MSRALRRLTSLLFSRGQAAECDRACPVCGSADAAKIDPLLGTTKPWICPLALRPLACARCWSLLGLRADGALVESDGLVDYFRRTCPTRWQAVAQLQRQARGRTLAAIDAGFPRPHEEK